MSQPRDKKIEEAGCKRMKLYHGDCLEIMKDISDGSIDMILCDLPYGTTACKWDTVIPFEPLWEQYERIIKNNGAIVLFGSEPFSSKLRMSNLKLFKYDWYWKKTRPSNFFQAKFAPLNDIEILSVFSFGKANNTTKNPIITYYPQGTIEIDRYAQNCNTGGKVQKNSHTSWDERNPIYHQTTTGYPKNILKFKNDIETIHPTQKPVALLEYLIKTYTNEGETVLDNCMGSGSTGIACMNTNRQFIGMEKEKKYFDIATKRIEEHQQQLRLL